MIGLCIGTGTWLPVARRAAAQMGKMTGIECHVIDRVDSNLTHPSWHKLNLLRDYPGEDLFIFDADMWCLKEWDPTQWPKGDDVIALCPDHNHNTNVRIESQLYHIPPGGYYNAGLMIVRPGAAELFKEAKKLHPRYGSWLDQTSLVHNIHAMKIPHTVMPRQYNGMLPIAMPAGEVAGTGVVNVHFAGRKDAAQLMKMFDELEAVQ